MPAEMETEEIPADAAVPDTASLEVVHQEVLMQKPTIEEFSAIPRIKLGHVVVPDRTGVQRVYRPLGQIHDSYLIVQTESGMLIIDQHALHERVMYEKYRHRFESMPSQSQELIVPMSLELNSRDYEILLSYSQVLKELGFDLEPFGKNTIRIRSIPIVLGHPCQVAVCHPDPGVALQPLSMTLKAMGNIIIVVAATQGLKGSQQEQPTHYCTKENLCLSSLPTVQISIIHDHPNAYRSRMKLVRIVGF